jgi:hypothetical protein
MLRACVLVALASQCMGFAPQLSQPIRYVKNLANIELYYDLSLFDERIILLEKLSHVIWVIVLSFFLI